MAYVFNPITGKLDDAGNPTTDASLLTSGTLADARLSANVSLDDQNNNFSASQTFAGSANTAPNQTAASGASLMTRDLVDARNLTQTTLVTLSSPVSYTSDTTGTTIFSVALEVGTYEVDQLVRFTVNGQNSKVTVLSGPVQVLMSGYRGTYNNGNSPVRIATVNATIGAGPLGITAVNDTHERGGVMYVPIAGVLTIAASQNTSSATTTTVGAGSYIKFRRIA